MTEGSNIQPADITQTVLIYIHLKTLLLNIVTVEPVLCDLLKKKQFPLLKQVAA